jgi:5-methyltetrahydropteroyltriglutamate--homocysteine methyltransferase
VTRSTDRILTSHTGALHRTAEFESVATRQFDPTTPPDPDFALRLPGEVEAVVRRQRELGIDLVNDGEYSKMNWINYASTRLGGLEESAALPPSMKRGLGGATDIARFPGFYADAAELDGVAFWRRGSEAFFNPSGPPTWPTCVGPVTYTGQDAVAADIANLKAALGAVGADPAEGFIGVAAPGTFGTLFADQHYGDREAYLFALADAIGEECRAIAEAGLVVQIDDPMLPSIHDMLELSRAETLELGELIVAATNRALEGIPEEQVRYHICWGSWNSPHTSDIELIDVIDLVYQVRAQTYSVEAANARHDHEWRVFEERPLPEGKVVMPGVIAHATNVVEHPQAVAERLLRYARIVGRENVVAGTDCGLRGRAHPEVAWAKLQALGEGAARASAVLWP